MIERLLVVLKGVRQTGPGRYMARCPAHDDHSPSLSLRETDDGRILIHCYAGCGAAAVMESVGLTLRDLMPESRGEVRASAALLDARDALLGLAESVAILTTIVGDIADGRSVSKGDADLFAVHAGVILDAARRCGLNLFSKKVSRTA